MFKSAKQQQKSIAQMRAKGLTLAQANTFAKRQRRGVRPVAVLVALAGVSLMGAGSYAAYQSNQGTDMAQALPALDVAGVRGIEIADEPMQEPQTVAAVAEPETDDKPTLVFAAPEAAPTAVDWEQAALLASGQIEVEEDVAADALDCVDDLRALASQTTLLFGQGETQPLELDADALLRMDAAAQACPGAKIVVAGHSDTSGTSALNLELSWQRADATLELMRAIGIDTTRFEPIGYGARLPFAQGSAEDDQVNRRVEFDVRRVDVN